MSLSEDFLYYIWQFRLFNTLRLFCVNGEALEVLKPGILNRDAGPDFSYARIQIGDTLWAGNVEIHLRASDWELHGHHKNKAYDSVILHVVYEYDRQIYRLDGVEVPVLVLKDLINPDLWDKYTLMIAGRTAFPCQQQIGAVNQMTVNGFLSRLLAERLEQKSKEVLEVLQRLKGDWNETFYRFLCRNFGFKINALPFEMLAASLPQQLLDKHTDQPIQVDALLFGQAGFLQQDFNEEYPSMLKTEYQFLASKYGIKNIDASVWKFLRTRPQSFPTLRIAQLSALLRKSNHLFSSVLEVDNLKQLYLLFGDIQVHEYWLRHYHFNKPASDVPLQLGRQSVCNILINTVCLFLFTYGKYMDQQIFLDRALDFLEAIPAEKNAIITAYSSYGVLPGNAFFSQAILQLNKCYCSQKKCLNCGIGIKILNR